MNSDEPNQKPNRIESKLVQRSRPADGVLQVGTHPPVVFVTVCTEKRIPWLVKEGSLTCLLSSWKQADAWIIGRYVVMPDHVHFFVSPGKMDVSLENWLKYWKSLFSNQIDDLHRRFQTGKWDTRIRTAEQYGQKWEYIRHNPVRHGLVSRPEDWPHQGILNTLHWDW